MFYHFIYLAKGFRMRPKVRSTLILHVPVNENKSKYILLYLENTKHIWTLLKFN